MQITRVKENLVKSRKRPYAPFAQRSVEVQRRVTLMREKEGNITILVISNVAGNGKGRKTVYVAHAANAGNEQTGQS